MTLQGALFTTDKAIRFPLFGFRRISFSQKYIMPIIIWTSVSLSTCFLDTMAFHSFPLDFLNSLNDFTVDGVLPENNFLLFFFESNKNMYGSVIHGDKYLGLSITVILKCNV